MFSGFQNLHVETLRNQATQSDIGAIIDRAMGEIESRTKRYEGLDKRFGRTQLSEGNWKLIDLISTIGSQRIKGQGIF